MTRAIVNDHGTIRLATLDAVPGAQAADPVEVALVAADIQPKDRQTALFSATTPEWVQVFSERHVGGGPAVTSRDGASLAALEPRLNAE